MSNTTQKLVSRPRKSVGNKNNKRCRTTKTDPTRTEEADMALAITLLANIQGFTEKAQAMLSRAMQEKCLMEQDMDKEEQSNE